MAASADQILTVLLSSPAGCWTTAGGQALRARRPLPGEPSQHTPESLSGDFRELYLLSRDEILWSQKKEEGPSILASDGNQPRRDDEMVQRLRKRMCYELTLATSSLYWTAR